jgi:hypothetical protein
VAPPDLGSHGFGRTRVPRPPLVLTPTRRSLAKKGSRQPPPIASSRHRGNHFSQPCAGRGRPISTTLPRPSCGRGLGVARHVTPRQTCPRPGGLGRNLRSKTRWFTGFCNSHQVSHFATFFIDARAEISVAESRSRIRNADIVRGASRPDEPVPLFVSLALAAPGFAVQSGVARAARESQSTVSVVRGSFCRYRQ